MEMYFERQAICFIIPYVAVCKLQENNTVDENDMYTVKSGLIGLRLVWSFECEIDKFFDNACICSLSSIYASMHWM